jgi:hypothetical protein
MLKTNDPLVEDHNKHGLRWYTFTSVKMVRFYFVDNKYPLSSGSTIEPPG